MDSLSGPALARFRRHLGEIGSGGAMTSERTQRLRSRSGYSLIELLTAVGIFGVLAAAGLPHVDTRRQNLDTAAKQVTADYRWTRTRAITGGVHFALKWTGGQTYAVQRMKQSGTSWVLDKTVKTVTLPSTIIHSGTPDAIEFNTRGMMVSATTVTWYDLTDTKTGGTRRIGVYPSGQADEYN
jgi:prepilin-type N-terminal cleavage/methylation domain-containing protein